MRQAESDGGRRQQAALHVSQQCGEHFQHFEETQKQIKNQTEFQGSLQLVVLQ